MSKDAGLLEKYDRWRMAYMMSILSELCDRGLMEGGMHITGKGKEDLAEAQRLFGHPTPSVDEMMVDFAAVQEILAEDSGGIFVTDLEDKHLEAVRKLITMVMEERKGTS